MCLGLLHVCQKVVEELAVVCLYNSLGRENMLTKKTINKDGPFPLPPHSPVDRRCSYVLVQRHIPQAFPTQLVAVADEVFLQGLRC